MVDKIGFMSDVHDLREVFIKYGTATEAWKMVFFAMMMTFGAEGIKLVGKEVDDLKTFVSNKGETKEKTEKDIPDFMKDEDDEDIRH